MKVRDKKRTLVTIIGTWKQSHSKNWIECESTWVPLLRDLGYDVWVIVSNTHMDKEFERRGNFFFVNCADTLNEIYYKSHYYISKWFINQMEYDYRFHLDSDSFIHPSKFDKFITEYTLEKPREYVGCVQPYPGLNPHELITKEFNNYSLYGHGGSGILLSKRVHTYLYDDFERSEHKNMGACDRIAGELLNRNGVKLWHDSRLLFESPYKRVLHDPHNIGIPFIGNKDSFLVSQHYCNGYMQEILNKLDL